MSTLFLISYYLLWALFLLQSVLTLLLLRQVGILHLRIAPTGARVMPMGPAIGDLAPSVTLVDMDHSDEQLHISPAMDSDSLLLFISPACAACASLMPAIRPLLRQTKATLRWAIIVSGERRSCHKFRQTYGLDYLLFAYSPKTPELYNIRPTPYAVTVRKDGIVVSKGLVNQVEHLESLLEAVRDADRAPAGDLHARLNRSSDTNRESTSQRAGTRP